MEYRRFSSSICFCIPFIHEFIISPIKKLSTPNVIFFFIHIFKNLVVLKRLELSFFIFQLCTYRLEGAAITEPFIIVTSEVVEPSYRARHTVFHPGVIFCRVDESRTRSNVFIPNEATYQLVYYSIYFYKQKPEVSLNLRVFIFYIISFHMNLHQIPYTRTHNWSAPYHGSGGCCCSDCRICINVFHILYFYKILV